MDHLPSRPDGEWELQTWRGSAGEFHAADLPERRALWWCRASSPALILGSSQSEGILRVADAVADGLEVVTRRTGGGLVFVDPSTATWIDVTIPRSDPHWTDDVSQSMMWLGEVLQRALTPWVHTVPHTGGIDYGEWGRLVCFAGFAPGELVREGDGWRRVKVTGISQRRGRWGARFQCLIHHVWEPRRWTPHLVDPEARRFTDDLVVGCIPETDPEILVAAIRQELDGAAGGIRGGSVGSGG